MFSFLIEELLNAYDPSFPLEMAIFMELFVSIHMTAFVFYPFSMVFFPKYPRIVTTTLLALRFSLYIIIDFFAPGFAMVDFFLVFIGAFTMTPLFMIKTIVSSIKYKGKNPNIADDKKLTRDELTKVRRIISIVYGIIGAFILSLKFIIYISLPIILSLVILTCFYLYLYYLYPKKHMYKDDIKGTGIINVDLIIYVAIILSSLAFFVKPRVIYTCDKNECKVLKYVEGVKVDKKVTIESKHKGKPVTTIGAYAFYGNLNILEVEIPKTVMSIEKEAFKKCNKLEYLEVSQDTLIDSNAVENRVELIRK